MVGESKVVVTAGVMDVAVAVAVVVTVAAAVSSSWAEVGHLEVLLLLMSQKMFSKGRLV